MNNGTEDRTSVRFTEEMKGYVAFGEDDYESGVREGRESDTRLMFHLTIEVEDLDRFVSDDRHEARAEGWVECEAFGGRLLVERGAFNLFVDEDEPIRKRMLYRLFFRDGVGHPLTLAGFKVLRGRSGAHVWRDTSTLFVQVKRGHVEEADEPGTETVASGILRLRPPDFLRQLATFRAGGPAPTGRAAAIGRFDALFLGQLLRVYGRRLAGVRSVPSKVRRRFGRWGTR